MGETLPPRIDPTAAGFRVTFPDASALLVEHVRRDSRRRLWAEVTAFDAAGQPLHMAQPDLLDQRQCTEFHGILEALAALLAYTPRGIAFVRDELTAWVLSMNQYKGGKGADRQHWLSFWSAHSSV